MAFAVDLGVCNSALASIGTRSTIASITEDSEEARNCAIWYESTLTQALRAARWGFASKTQSLALYKSVPATGSVSVWSDTYPAPPWRYEYLYPTDCIMLQYVMGQSQLDVAPTVPIFGAQTASYATFSLPRLPFEVGNDLDAQGNQLKVVLTQAYQALGRYTVLATNAQMWDPLFNNTMIAALAGNLAMPLRGDRALMQQMMQQANTYLIEARVSDANEGLTVIDQPVDWIEARGGWAGSSVASPYIAPYGPLFGTT